MTTNADPQPAMTSGEAWALAEAAEWRFDQYYKFSFYFKAAPSGRVLSAQVGGRSEDIYRYTVTASPMAWKEVIDGGECHLTVADEAGAVLWEGWPL